MIFEKSEIIEKNINLDFIIKQIFTDEPSPVNSIIIKFNNDHTKKLFENLLELFTQGLSILSNKEIISLIDSIDFFSDSNITQINKYFNSFSFCVNYKSISIDDFEKYKRCFTDSSVNYIENNITLKDILNYKYITSDTLEDYRFNITNNENKIIYILWFTPREC